MKGSIVRMGSEQKGFGFILGENNKDYFFHKSYLLHCRWNDLAEGDAVEFIPKSNDGKLVATNVKKYFSGLYDVAVEDVKQGKISPGIHKMVKLDSFNDEERNIIKTLGRTFYVTNGGENILLGATSEYRYCLVKPTDYFGEQFNLKREIIVIFSNYECFEPRTFDAISEVYRRNNQQFRIDRICSIIISKDNEVVKKIQDI